MTHIPFFILGNPRSGTSLFRLMLNSHPNIIVPPESGFLQWWYQKYKDWNSNDSQNRVSTTEYVSDILSSKKIEDWKLNEEELKNKIFTINPKNYAELSLIVYLSYNNNSNSEILKIGDKNNYYIHHLSTIDQIYPKSKYIHLIRDGRDVACSYKNLKSLKSDSNYLPKLPAKLKSIALEWKNNITMVDNFLANKPNLKIRYEDLLKEPQNTLTKVCDFLKIRYNPIMLDFYFPEMNDEPASTKDWKMKTFDPIDKYNYGKYKRELSPIEISEFNEICRLNLLKYGYELL